jgi:hypothetical protein
MIGVLEWGVSVRSAEGGGDNEQDADAELATRLDFKISWPFLKFWESGYNYSFVRRIVLNP